MSGISQQVDRAINTGTDQIDYSRAFDIIERLTAHQNERQQAFQSIYNYISRGARRERLNAIQFIDVLFKNSEEPLLKDLQASPQILALGNEKIQNDPFCHRVVTKLIPEWVKSCNDKDCITPQFQQWAKTTTSYQFQYQLTPEIIEKFRNDFQDCVDMLQMFSSLLNKAATEHKTADDPLIQEIFPNILEIHNRLKELATSMPDQYIVSIINYLCEFCEEAKAAFRSLSSTGYVDVTAINEVSSRGLPKPGQPQQLFEGNTLTDVKRPDPSQQPAPSPLPQPPNTRPIQPVQQQQNSYPDLLDLGLPPSNQNQNPNQPPTQPPQNQAFNPYAAPPPQNQGFNPYAAPPPQNQGFNPYAAPPPQNQGFNPYAAPPSQNQGFNPYAAPAPSQNQQSPYQQPNLGLKPFGLPPTQNQNPGYNPYPQPPQNQQPYGSGGYGYLPQSNPYPNPQQTQQQNPQNNIQKPPSNLNDFEFADD